MRDIALTLFIFGCIPYIFKYPWIGVLVSVWISIFTPHGYTFGFANKFPFAMIIAVVTFLAMFFRSDQVRFPLNGITILLLLFPLWMTVTLLFALEPDAAWVQWVRVMKIWAIILTSVALLHTRKQLEVMLWVITVSVGFYGIKGGLFTLGGGSGQVWGPPGENIISDNNQMGVALIMVIPVMKYLAGVASSKWIRRGLTGAMLLSGMAALGTMSRGALLAGSGMLAMLWLKSRKKLLFGLLLIIIVPVGIGVMSDKWAKRMATIETYQEDDSAMGRINAWAMLFNLANSRPLVGGGFGLYTMKTYNRYAPDQTKVAAAHSIYFQVLGEHGYVGLALFLGLGFTSWMTARRIIRETRKRADCAWAADLARAMQVSLFGFAVGGAFLSMAYWEMVYYEMVILMATYRLVGTAAPAPDQGQGAATRKKLAGNLSPR